MRTEFINYSMYSHDPLEPIALPPLIPLAIAGDTAAEELPPSTKRMETQTAKKAVEVLVAKNEGFHEPTRAERDALLVGFAMHRKVLYGAAFDIIRLSRPVDLKDPAAISANMDAITIYEIKSTNRNKMSPDFKGYFFNLTTAELLVAQSLGTQFRFAFVNVLTKDYADLTLNELFGKAKAIYPAWHIKF